MSNASVRSSSSKIKNLGDYFLYPKNLIGRGTFAEVYEGTHRSTSQPVAIKIILRSKLNDKLMASLELETNIMRKIEHKNIIRLYAVHRSKRHFYLVMEKCSGGELSTFIRKNKKPLDNIVVKKFLRDLANGLRCMWEMNLVHRDLKPANLLLDYPSSIDPINPLANLGTLKIADFGFAREITPGSMAETMCGSPLYMAPEVLTNKPYDAKADLWSVGIILYEMLYGQIPFKANNVVQLIHTIEKTIPHLSVTKNVDAAGVDLMRGLLQRDPAHRFSFQDFYNHPYLGFKETISSTLIPMTTTSTLSSSPSLHPTILSNHSKTLSEPVPNIDNKSSITMEDYIHHPSSSSLSSSPIHSLQQQPSSSSQQQQQPSSSPSNNNNNMSSPNNNNKLVKPPKTSPFVGGTNLEYSTLQTSQQLTPPDHPSSSSSSNASNQNQNVNSKFQFHACTMSTMVQMTQSGHIDYPSIIFDFSHLKMNSPDQSHLIEQAEVMCKRAWASPSSSEQSQRSRLE